MNGFDPNTLDEADAAKLLEGLLDQSEKQFGHKCQRQVSDFDARLNRYFYVFGEGQSTEERTEQQREWSEKLSGQHLDQLVTAAPPGSSCDITIKCENPAYKALQQELSTMKARKRMLEAVVSGTQDFLATLMVKSKKDGSLQTKAKEVEEMSKHSTSSLEVVRTWIGEAELEVDATTDQQKTDVVLRRAHQLKDIITTHTEGWKLAKRRLLPLLS